MAKTDEELLKEARAEATQDAQAILAGALGDVDTVVLIGQMLESVREAAEAVEAKGVARKDITAAFTGLVVSTLWSQ